MFAAAMHGAEAERRHRVIQPMQCLQLRGLMDELAASIGTGHMLTQGAMRHFAQMRAMSKDRA